MSNAASKKISAEAQSLVEMGEGILIAHLDSMEHEPDGITELFELSHGYQEFYSKSRRIVEFSTPQQLEEFDLMHRRRGDRALSDDNYSISDYFLGIELPEQPLGMARSIVLAKMNRQLSILKSAISMMESSIWNITIEIEANLFDNELEAATELLRANHIRAAGAFAGVIVERHLLLVCKNHAVAIAKAKPTLNDLNTALKTAKVYDNILWRRIQSLGDIRNICAHGTSEREPNSEEVTELIAGVSKIIKTVI